MPPRSTAAARVQRLVGRLAAGRPASKTSAVTGPPPATASSPPVSTRTGGRAVALDDRPPAVPRRGSPAVISSEQAGRCPDPPGAGRPGAAGRRPSPTTSRIRTRAPQFQAFTCRPSRAGRAARCVDHLARAPSLDQAGGLGALADGRLADAEPAGRLVVRQSLVDQVGDLPALVGSAGRGPRPTARAPTRGRGRSPSSPTTRRCQGLFLAAVTAARAWRYAGPRPARALSGSGSSTVADADADVPASVPEQALDGRGSAAGSSSTPCISSPAVRSKGRRSGRSARPATASDTRSGVVRLPRWSTVSTTTVIAPPQVRGLHAQPTLGNSLMEEEYKDKA